MSTNVSEMDNAGLAALRTDLLQQLHDVNVEIAHRKPQIIAELRATAKQSAAELGLTLADLFHTTSEPQHGGRSNVKPKYRDPATGKTWSGRGKRPAWMRPYVTRDGVPMEGDELEQAMAKLKCVAD